MKFIYVFSEKDRDLLIERGFTLLKQHGSRDIWVLINNENARACFDDIDCVFSNTLTF